MVNPYEDIVEVWRTYRVENVNACLAHGWQLLEIATTQEVREHGDKALIIKDIAYVLGRTANVVRWLPPRTSGQRSREEEAIR